MKAMTLGHVALLSLFACGEDPAEAPAAEAPAAPAEEAPAAEAPAAEAPAAEAPAAEAPAAEAPGSFTSKDLVGTWQGPCFPSPQGDGSFNQLTFKMTEGEWNLAYGAFGNEACTAKFLTVDIQGPYTLGAASEAGEGAREAEFGFATKTVTPHMEPAVAVVNGACGVETAKVGEALDVAAGCAGLGAHPIADCGSDHDIVMVKGDTLHFGARPADNNMCSPDKRPSTFEGGAAVQKQAG